MDKEKKILNKSYLFPSLIILVIIFILYKFTFPQISQIIEVRRNLKGESERLERLSKKANELERLNAENLKKNFQIIQETLASDKDVSGLLFAMARLQSETSVSVEKFQLAPGLISTPAAAPSQATPSGASAKGKTVMPTTQTKNTSSSLSSLVFDLTLSGDYSAIRTFLDKITQIKPLLTVSSLKINQKEDEGVKADFKISFPYQPLSSTLGKIDDSLPVLTQKDEEVIAEISLLPVYNQVVAIATAAAGKANPFE